MGSRSEGTDGFIVHAFTRRHRNETQLCLIGRLEGGETFAALFTNEQPRFFIRASDASRARQASGPGAYTGIDVSETAMRTIDGETCYRVARSSQSELSRFLSVLNRSDIRTYEADIRLPDAFLINKSIHGSVSVAGKWQPGRRVDRIYVDPEVAPSEWTPRLSLASVDIETNPFGSEIYAISTHFRNQSGSVTDIVFLRSPPASRGSAESTATTLPTIAEREGWRLVVLATERELLLRWTEEIVRLDPDLITGWNVAGFDFKRITERLEHHGIPFRVGRSEEAGTFFPPAPGKPASVVVPGRQVLDGLRIARSGPQRFSDHSLETVAQEVLGRGKTLKPEGTREKLNRIEEMYQNDPLGLCRYCLEDARLVTDILDTTGLLELTLKRSLLIGVPLSRAWTNVAAFDFVYIEALHRRGIVAPTLGVDALPIDSAPGGAIISPASGLFDNVFVFDFKSLYPSIIRTFNIDPLSYCGSDARGTPPPAADGGVIRAPNGACFRREVSILPHLLEDFFAGRETAKREGDETAAYVYKILMNSFYGVLGTPGCRFAGSDLAGAITGFGQRILYWCRDLLEEKGHRTLYGDTDSLFVESGLERGANDDLLLKTGRRLCTMINEELSRYIRSEYDLPSRLELEFEKTYVRFFVPPLRGQATPRTDAAATAPRGRSKGYAGYLHALDRGGEVGEPAVEVKGMEAVRRDWTPAARELQLTLLRMLFEDAPPAEISGYIRDYIARVRSGALDEKLVYSKMLRKAVAGYTSSLPPHVQAARHLPKPDQSGLIDYLWTVDGPQPAAGRQSPIDYDHYVDKQLKPIALAFSEVLHADLARLFEDEGQLSLF